MEEEEKPQVQLMPHPNRGGYFTRKYSDAQWEEAEYLVKNRPDMTYEDISKKVGMNSATLQKQAITKGWSLKRNIAVVRQSNKALRKVVKDVALQINDMHNHTVAMMNAIQYSHRIKVCMEENGTMVYKNFIDWPDRPADFDELPPEVQEAHLLMISPQRLYLFHKEIRGIMNIKMSIIDFVQKLTKADLPKVDPDVVDMSRVASDSPLNEAKVFTSQSSEKKLLDSLLENVDNDVNNGDNE